MTSIASVVLALQPLAAERIPSWTGHTVRHWLLNLTQAYDADLADELQSGDSARPYTVSGLLTDGKLIRRSAIIAPNQTYEIRLTTLRDDLTELWREDILPELPGTILESGDLRLRVERCITDSAEHLRAGVTTDAELFEQAALNTGRMHRHAELIFASPASFKHTAGFHVPFPLPELVFGNLIDRWNTFNAIKLHPDARRFARERVTANRHRLCTMYVQFGDGETSLSATAFTGFCRYVVLSNDRYWRGVIQALAAYSIYAGVGAHTTFGFGSTQHISPD